MLTILHFADRYIGIENYCSLELYPQHTQTCLFIKMDAQGNLVFLSVSRIIPTAATKQDQLLQV